MVVAIIPARGGSKRIPRKNIKNFCGKPMIAYSIEAAIQSKLFDKIVVSTDDDEIAKVALAYGAEVPFIRSNDLSDDYTNTTEVIIDAITQLQKTSSIDVACCIYATAPFIRMDFLKDAYHTLIKEESLYTFSATSFSFPIQRAFKINQKNSIEMFYPEHALTRSQDLEEAFHDAGQFYFAKPSTWLAKAPIFSKGSKAIILPRHLVQDIDTLEDFKQAELMYKALQADS